jgi:hypothetical protein
VSRGGVVKERVGIVGFHMYVHLHFFASGSRFQIKDVELRIKELGFKV